MKYIVNSPQASDKKSVAGSCAFRGGWIHVSLLVSHQWLISIPARSFGRSAALNYSPRLSIMARLDIGNFFPDTENGLASLDAVLNRVGDYHLVSSAAKFRDHLILMVAQSPLCGFRFHE